MLLKRLASEPPGSKQVFSDLPEIGGIPGMRGSSRRAKAIKLPFGGAGHVDFALVRGAICVAERAAADRQREIKTKGCRAFRGGRLARAWR